VLGREPSERPSAIDLLTEFEGIEYRLFPDCDGVEVKAFLGGVGRCFKLAAERPDAFEESKLFTHKWQVLSEDYHPTFAALDSVKATEANWEIILRPLSKELLRNDLAKKKSARSPMELNATVRAKIIFGLACGLAHCHEFRCSYQPCYFTFDGQIDISHVHFDEKREPRLVDCGHRLLEGRPEQLEAIRCLAADVEAFGWTIFQIAADRALEESHSPDGRISADQFPVEATNFLRDLIHPYLY
jgi:hypothetical protein